MKTPEPVRTLVSKELVMKDGREYIRSLWTSDYGPGMGVARIEVWDPCVTEESRKRRREEIERVCADLVRRGL